MEMSAIKYAIAERTISVVKPATQTSEWTFLM